MVTQGFVGKKMKLSQGEMAPVDKDAISPFSFVCRALTVPGQDGYHDPDKL